MLHIYLKVILGLFTVGRGNLQLLNEQVLTSGFCANDIITASCSEDQRMFVTEVNVGSKPKQFYSSGNCTQMWETGVTNRELCCSRDDGDCYGLYQPENFDPYTIHKDCTGRKECIKKPALYMQTVRLNNCNGEFNEQTTYIEIRYYCINVTRILDISSGQATNNGEGSALYLWSGTAGNYLPQLPIFNNECSVETDCEGTIKILSLDFRFNNQNETLECLSETHMEVNDGNITKAFDCSNNNYFIIRQLYESKNNYIKIPITNNDMEGGFLWLAFMTSTNGNLTIDCNKPRRLLTCVETNEYLEATTAITIEDHSTLPKTTQYVDLNGMTTNITSTESEISTTNYTMLTPVIVESTFDECVGEYVAKEYVGIIAGIVGTVFGFFVKACFEKCQEKCKNNKISTSTEDNPPPKAYPDSCHSVLVIENNTIYTEHTGNNPKSILDHEPIECIRFEKEKKRKRRYLVPIEYSREETIKKKGNRYKNKYDDDEDFETEDEQRRIDRKMRKQKEKKTTYYDYCDEDKADEHFNVELKRVVETNKNETLYDDYQIKTKDNKKKKRYERANRRDYYYQV